MKRCELCEEETGQIFTVNEYRVCRDCVDLADRMELKMGSEEDEGEA